MKKRSDETIAVVGMGYVGLPAAVALARRYETVVGFDINAARIKELRNGIDRTGELSDAELSASTAHFTNEAAELRGASFFIISVPTPIDVNHRPDLGPLIAASKTVGGVLGRGAVVVYESTVYPGVTEEICAPILEEHSGLKSGVDFHLGYSPERVNPGDREHTFESITKVVAGDTPETLERVAAVYGNVVKAGVHRASSIKIAEAAKVIENIQRDLNIALMNELAVIFDRLGISTLEVLEAAGTKWNFLPFRPGLVGGHCIGVDPYYLTTRAEQAGYHPEVILAGRRINDKMGEYVAHKCVKLLIQSGKAVHGARVGVLGITFKENIPDIRNSRVASLVKELRSFSITPIVHDPHAYAEDVRREYHIELSAWEGLRDLDCVILASPHNAYLERMADLRRIIEGAGVVLDVKSALRDEMFSESVVRWSL